MRWSALAALVACQSPYHAPCTARAPLTLTTATLQSLSWADTHVRGLWYDIAGVHAAEWDTQGQPVTQLSAKRTVSTSGLSVVVESDLFTGSALVALSPIQTAPMEGHVDLVLQPLTPAGDPRVIYSCDNCGYVAAAQVVGAHILILIDGGDAPLLLVVTPQGVVDKVFATPLSSNARIVPGHEDALSVLDDRGWWRVDENGDTVAGPVAVSGAAIDWDPERHLVAIGSTREEASREVYLARTDFTGVGPVLHLSQGHVLASALGAHLAVALFGDDAFYFAAMGTNARKLGGDVALGENVARAIVRESAPDDFSIAFSGLTGTALQHVICTEAPP